MEEHKDGAFDSTKDRIEDAAEKIGKEAKEAAKEIRESWNETTNNGENKKLVAGLLGILVGSLGIHKFILGYTQEGIVQIVITIVTCGIGGIIGFIEGIIYLTKSDDEFYQTYQVGKRGWF